VVTVLGFVVVLVVLGLVYLAVILGRSIRLKVGHLSIEVDPPAKPEVTSGDKEPDAP